MQSVGKYLESLFSLDGKVILLTGAAGGIGEAFARGLAAAGGTVALCDLNVRRCEEIASELAGESLSTKPYHLDISDIDSIKNCVDSVLTIPKRSTSSSTAQESTKEKGF